MRHELDQRSDPCSASAESGRAGVAQGDGGSAGFDVSDPSVRLHTFTSTGVEVSYVNGDDGSWLSIGQPLTGESSFFYAPMVSDPVQGGTVYFGMQRVWRTTDNGGDRSQLQAHCRSQQEDGSIAVPDVLQPYMGGLKVVAREA